MKTISREQTRKKIQKKHERNQPQTDTDEQE